MTEQADILIIGGGIMGASIAFQITRRSDAKVVLVDQHPPVGGMSGRTFGQIRQHYSNELLVNLAMRGCLVLKYWRASSEGHRNVERPSLGSAHDAWTDPSPPGYQCYRGMGVQSFEPFGH